MRDVVEVELPCGMHTRAIRCELLRRKILATVNRNRHHGGRSIREPHAGARERHLHEVLGKVAGGMTHPLMRRRDVHSCGVIVRPEMRTGESSTRHGRNSWQE